MQDFISYKINKLGVEWNRKYEKMKYLQIKTRSLLKTEDGGENRRINIQSFQTIHLHWNNTLEQCHRMSEKAFKERSFLLSTVESVSDNFDNPILLS